MVTKLTTGMTDKKILAHYRQIYPYISMRSVTALYRTGRKFHHLGAAVEEKRQQAVEEERPRLRALVSGK